MLEGENTFPTPQGGTKTIIAPVKVTGGNSSAPVEQVKQEDNVFEALPEEENNTPELEALPEDDTPVELSGTAFEQKKITPTVQFKKSDDNTVNLNPDVTTQYQPLPYSIENVAVGGLGIRVPVVKYVPIFKDEQQAGQDLMTPGVPNKNNAIKLNSEERENEDYNQSVFRYLNNGGVPKFDNLSLGIRKRLLDESELNTPDEYKGFIHTVTPQNIPFSQSSKELSGAVKSVYDKMGLDYNELEKSSKEFTSLEKDIGKAKSDIEKKVRSSEEYGRYKESENTFKKVQGIVTKMNDFSSKVESSEESKQYKDIEAVIVNQEKVLGETKEKLDGLQKTIESGKYSDKDYEQYKTTLDEYNRAVTGYTDAAKKAKSVVESISNKEEFKGYQSLHKELEAFDIDKIQKDYEASLGTVNEKYKAEGEAKKGELDTRYKTTKDKFESIFPASVFGKAKAKYGDVESAQGVQSQLTSDANDSKYAVLVKSGLVSAVPSTYPESVKEFVHSNTYLNSTAAEKKYFLNYLYNKNEDKLNGATRQDFFRSLEGTIIPKLDAVMAKSMASETAKKVDNLIAKHKDVAENGIERGEWKSTAELNKLLDIKKSLSSVMEADYENESGWAEGFYKSWSGEQAMPFYGGIRNMQRNSEIKKISDFVSPDGKFVKSNYDKLSETDKLLYDTHGLVNSYQQLSNPDIKHQLGGIIAKSFSFMGEMALTGGASRAMSKGIVEMVPSVISSAAKWSPTVAKGFEATAEIAGKFISPGALLKAEKVALKTTEITAQSLMSGSQHIAANTAERLTNENSFFFSSEANKIISDVNEANSDNFFNALVKSSLSQLAETGTEHLSDLKLFGMGGVGGKFMNRAASFTEEDFKLLSAASHISEKTLRATRSFIENSKAGDYMSRLAMSDFAVWMEKKSAQLGAINPLKNPKNYSSAAVKNFFKDAHFGGFGMEFFEEFVNNRITPLVENQEDLLYKYPFQMGAKEAKDITLGILPIFVAGGAANLAATIYSKRIGSDIGKVNDFSEVVSNLSKEEFHSRAQELYDKANSFAGKGATDAALDMMELRNNFETQSILGVQAGIGFKEYFDKKTDSKQQLGNALSLIKDNNLSGASDIVTDQIINAPDNESRDRFLFIQNRMAKHGASEESYNLYQDINDTFKQLRTLENKVKTFSYVATGLNPENIKSEIDKLDVTEEMKRPLLTAYETLEREYNDNLKKFGITKITNDAPDEMVVDGFSGNKLTFKRNSDGQYTVEGIEDEEKDASALSSQIGRMTATTVTALFNSVNGSNLSDTFKEKVSKVAMSEMTNRIEDLKTIEEIGHTGLLSVIDSVNTMAESSSLSKEQKESLSSSLRRVFSNSIKLAETIDDLKNIQKVAFNLNEFSNILDLSTVSQINQSINRRILRKENVGKMSPVEDVEDNSIDIPDETDNTFSSGQSRQQKNRLAEKLKSIKAGINKSWNKALTNHVNKANLNRIDKALDKLVEAGHISDRGKNLITSSIMNTGWLTRLISLEGIITRTAIQEVAHPDNFSGTHYDPETKKIIIASGYSYNRVEQVASESEHVREILEEILHNAHHQLFIGITGNTSTINLSEEEVDEVTRNSQSDVIKNVVDFYKSYNFKYNDFLAISEKALNERTPDEVRLYDEMIDYLSKAANTFSVGKDTDLMNLSFTDEYSGKVFTTKKLVENFRRYKLFQELGYNSQQSFYYSKDYREFFARVFSDVIIERTINKATQPTINSIVDNTRNFFSDTVKLPAIARFLKSSLVKSIDKNEVFAGMSQHEIDAIMRVQSSVEEFYNDEQRQIFQNINPIMRDILFGDNSGDVLLDIGEILNNESYERLDEVFTELYQKASKIYGDESVFIYLDQLLKGLNLSNGRISIDSKTMYDYIVDKFSGTYIGTFEDYFDNTDNALNSIRGFNTGLMTREERQLHDHILNEIMANDVSTDEIYKKYGIYLDKDANLKQFVIPELEINNKPKVLVNSENQEYYTFLSQIIDFPKLFRIYPEAKNIPVVLLQDAKNDMDASFDFLTETIEIGKRLTDSFYGKEDTSRFVAALLHEVQHYIQFKEGFGIGSSYQMVVPASYLDNIFSALKKIDLIGNPNISGTESFDKYYNLSSRLAGGAQAALSDIHNLVRHEEVVREAFKSQKRDELNPLWSRMINITSYHLHLGESEARLVENLYHITRPKVLVDLTINDFLRSIKSNKEIDVLSYKDTMQEDEIVYAPFKPLNSSRGIEYKSNTLQAVEDTKLTKASGQQWLTQILSRGGNKTEIQRYGLDSFLGDGKSKSKQDILDYLSDKVMKVKDVILGGEIDKTFTKLNSDFERYRNSIINRGFEIESIPGDEGFLRIKRIAGSNRESSITVFDSSLDKPLIEQIRESEYYKGRQEREIKVAESKIEDFLTARNLLNDYESLNQGIDKNQKDTRWSDYTTFPLNNYRELLPVIDTDKKLFSHDSHFSGIQNQLYHNRLNDVVTESGKHLLLSEEMQADWTQREPDKMSLDSSDRADRHEIERDIRDAINEIEFLNREIEKQKERGFAEEPLNKKRLEEWNAALEIRKERLKKFDKEHIEDRKSPFTQTSDLVRAAIKRMIKMAVEEGKDGIAWTPAHLQVERWSNATRAVVDNISWKPIDMSKTPLSPITREPLSLKTGIEVIGDKDGGEVFKRNFYLEDGEYLNADKQKLSEVVGSEMSKRIISEETGKLSGENIIVGGQGYIDIYDKTAVNVANKIAKKYGLEVGQETVGGKNVSGKILEDGSYEREPIKVHSLLFNDDLIQDFSKSHVLPLYAKRAFTVDHSAFITLIANSKGNLVTDYELFQELKKIEINLNKFDRPQKLNASLEANQLVQMWKLQYLKNKMPKISKSRLSEIVKLTRIPIRAKIADYVKDVNFIKKYVTDTEFRSSYEKANKALDTARTRYGNNFRKNVKFYMALSKLTKVKLAMFDTAKELDAFSELLTQNPTKVNMSTFEQKANDYYNQYIDWKEAPEEKMPNTANSLAQQQADTMNRAYLNFVKSTVLPRITFTDPFIQNIIDIDESELEGNALKDYAAHIEYLAKNGDMNASMYDFTQTYLSEKAAIDVQSTMDEDFVKLLNSKVVGNEIKEWFKGSIFSGFISKDNLGNISHYNLDDFVGFASDKLNEVMLRPLKENNEKLSGLIEDIMKPLLPHANGLAQEDMVAIGIWGLLKQKPELRVGKKSAILLNNEFNTDIFKDGMSLNNSSIDIEKQGYERLLQEVNRDLAKSIAMSYGEVSEGVSEEQAARAKRITAERRGMTERELDNEKESFLKLFGAGVYGLQTMNDILATGFLLTPAQEQWLGNVRDVFTKIKDGHYTNGVGLESASVVRSADNFINIEDYFPILRYNESEVFSEFEADTANQIFYGYSKDFYLNEGFLERRKQVVMALNPNAWEAVGRKIDQQLFYLLNIDQKKFLSKLLKTDIFNGKTDSALSRYSTNLVKDALNVIFNRGVSRSQTALLNSNSKIVAGIKTAMENLKPFYIGAIGNAPAQITTTVTAMASMKGNPISRIASMVKGFKYVAHLFDYDSPMNQLLRDHAREVYYRGLADYQIPMAEEGVLVRSSLAGISQGAYERSRDKSMVSHYIDAIRNKNFRTAVQLAGLVFMDRLAARVSFFELYENYAQQNGIKVNYSNPDMDAVEFALQGVRATQHTSSNIFQSFIGKGIVPGSDNMNQGELAAVGDIMLSSVLAFRTFSLNEKKFLNKQVFKLRNAESSQDVTDALQSISYVYAGRIMFHLIKNLGNLTLYGGATALAFSGGDWDKFKGKLKPLAKEYFNVKNVLAQSAFDTFVIGEIPARLAAYGAKALEKKIKGVDKLSKWEARAYPNGDNLVGGFALDMVNQFVQMSNTAANDVADIKSIDGIDSNLKKNYPDYAQLALFLTTAIYGSVLTPFSGADINKMLKEIEREKKMSGNQKMFDITGGSNANTSIENKSGF